MFDALGYVACLMVKHAGTEKTASYNTAMLQSPQDTLEQAYLNGFRSALGVPDVTKEAAYASQLGNEFALQILVKMFGGQQ